MSIQKLKEHYEKALLVVGSTVALGMVGTVAARQLTFGEMFSADAIHANHELPETGMSSLNIASQRLQEASTWEGRNLFVSAPVLEVNGQQLQAFEPEFPESWMQQYQLDPMDPSLASKDPDHDQFTNAEEFANETDPTNASSYPPMITKLRLVAMTDIDLALILQGRVDERNYQIDLVSKGKTETNLVEIGEAFGPTDQFRLENYEEKRTADAQDIPLDRSEAVISHQEIGGLARNKVRLQLGIQWDMPSHEARFENLLDDEQVVVKRGDRLVLSKDAGRTYLLQSVTSSGAIFVDENDKAYEVLPQK